MIDYLNYGKQVQSITKEPQNEPEMKVPNISGWLEYKLNTQEMDYIWRCVDKKSKRKVNYKLAGNIDSSFALEDKDDWFFINTIIPLVEFYEQSSGVFGSTGSLVNKVPIYGKECPYGMKEWWVNYQKQYEFNPSHGHKGIYSFVIWLKIPYEYEEQNKDIESNSKSRGIFSFRYVNMFGDMHSCNYNLGKKFEGTMLFFPSKLQHEVFPFYNCEEERISVSGNILIKV